MKTRLIGFVCVAMASIVLFSAAMSADAGEKKKKGDKKKVTPEQIFKKLDKDGNDKLSQDEFLAMAAKVKDEGKREKLREKLTATFAANSTDGQMSLSQFENAMKKAKGKGKNKKKKKDAN